MRNTQFTKIAAVIIIHAFFVSASGFPAAQPKTDEIDKIVIPKQAGIIRSKFAGSTGKVIIHIQDAHCNYEAQSNIVTILEDLIKNNSLSLISVEGADGFVDTSWFKTFPGDQTRKQVATYFMKKGQITGPEFLSITSAPHVRLFGAETRSYYLENLNAFTSSYPLKADAEKYYSRIKNILTKLKAYIYNKDLKLLDATLENYELKKIQLNDYLRTLEGMAEKYHIDLKAYDIFNITDLFLYDKKIVSAIKEKLFENEDQRTLDRLYRNIDILLNLVEVRLTNDDFEYYESHKNEFSHDVFSSFIKRKSTEIGLAYSLEMPDDAVDKAMPMLENFYSVAKKRDKALVENTLDAMSKEGIYVAALITGGFHSEGIAKLLKSQGVSYLVICPSITRLEPTPYIQILTNQKMSFNDVPAGPEGGKKGGTLAPILISRLISLADEKILAYFGPFQTLAKAVMTRVRYVKDAWIAMSRPLESDNKQKKM